MGSGGDAKTLAWPPDVMRALVTRIAAILLAAAFVIGGAVFYARNSRPEIRRRRAGPNTEASETLRRFRLRPRGPQLSRIGSFAGEAALLALIAAGGRYLLRIRL